MTAASGGRRPRILLLALALPLVGYWLLWATTLSHVHPSGDAASTWASRHPTRTVLCVEDAPGGAALLTLAAAPTPLEQGAVDAQLTTTEVAWGSETLGLVFRDHTYAASLRVAGAEIPWMINPYTGGFSDWLEQLATRLAGSVQGGFVATAALGALALLLTMLVAAGVAGSARAPAAAWIAGMYLATEPSFHIWKHVGTGREVWLQIAAVGSFGLLLLAWRRRSVGWLGAAMALAGLGLHDKLSFLGPLGALVVGSAVLALRELRPFGRRQAASLLLVGSLALSAAMLPSLVYWTVRPELPQTGASETLGDSVDAVLGRLLGKRPPTDEDEEPDEGEDDGPGGPAEEQGEDQRSGTRGEGEGRDPKRQAGVARFLLRPDSFWLSHWSWAAGDRRSERGTLRLLLLAAGLLALVGVLRAREDDGIPLRWAATVALLQLVFIRLLSGDPHHIAMALPMLAVVLGAGATHVLAPLGRRSLPIVAGLAVAVGGGWILSRLDHELVDRAGRLFDERSLETLAERLPQLEATAPAVLEYEMMSLLEAYSSDQVRPFFYGVAGVEAGAERCLPREDPRWLGAVLRAHAGSHLLAFWARGTADDQGVDLVAPWRLAAAAADEGLVMRQVEVFEDDRGRWFATLWAIDRL